MGCHRPNARTIAKGGLSAEPFRAVQTPFREDGVFDVRHAGYAVCAASCDVCSASCVLSVTSRGGVT